MGICLVTAKLGQWLLRTVSIRRALRLLRTATDRRLRARSKPAGVLMSSTQIIHSRALSPVLSSLSGQAMVMMGAQRAVGAGAGAVPLGGGGGGGGCSRWGVGGVWWAGGGGPSPGGAGVERFLGISALRR